MASETRPERAELARAGLASASAPGSAPCPETKTKARPLLEHLDAVLHGPRGGRVVAGISVVLDHTIAAALHDP
ncbi:hypothetical protein SAMN05216532_0548 [Streptomyces sp. 2231.1]|uniref:hypothetical protein n=1 Tax=Streptomyces sp. 2231.1 TaxID=1855347 RepID=UPI000896C08D|nr:hypothetical protein [Streptomyces sp. 2231.1]SEC12606.1 hypothetical protein SAMN05216532_0548 [Streptomyces sp. 2231.1]